MPRLHQVPKDEATAPIVTTMYEWLFEGRDPVAEPGRWDGTSGDWWTVFANSPDILDHCVKGFGLYQSPTRTLDPKLRELGQIRAGWAAGSQFVYSQHAKSMRELEMPEPQITHIPAWSVAPAGTYDEAERAVLAYTDCLVYDHGRVPDQLFAELRRHLERRGHPRAHLHHHAVFSTRSHVQGTPHRVRRPGRSHRRGARTQGGQRNASWRKSVTAAHTVLPTDEQRHEPDDDALWNESYYCDFVQADGTLGGWLRLGLYPNLGVAWWTAWIVRPGQPGICSVDYRMPIPPGTGLVSASAPDAAHPAAVEIDIRRPLEEFRLAVPSMQAQQFAQPEDAYTDSNWEAVEASLDLTWTTDGVPYHYDVTTRYEIPCLVAGTVTIGGESFTVKGQGQRDHSWGVRDWWAFGWCWNSMRLDDATRVHVVDIRFDGFQAFFGYVQTPDRAPGVAHPVTALKLSEDLGAHGFPTTARVELTAGLDDEGQPALPPVHDIGLDVTPVAFGPVLLRNDEDGRISFFPRAMVQCRTDDGRIGSGWIEWNQPQQP